MPRMRAAGLLGSLSLHAALSICVVLTRATAAQSLPELRLSATPRVVLGDRPATPRDELVDVIAATKLASGHIAIADRGSYDVRVYDRAGRLLARSGRRGRGPGDFDGFARMWRGRGDSLYVWDHAQSRLSVFSPQVTWVRSQSVLGDLPHWHFLVGQFADGSFLSEMPLPTPPPSRSGVVVREMLLLRAAANGRRADTLGRFLRSESIVLVSEDGTVTGSSRIPLARYGHTAVDGDVFMASDSGGRSIGVHDRTGRKIRSIAVPGAPFSLTRAQRELAKADLIGDPRMPPTFRRSLSGALDAVLQRPVVAYDSVLADGRGETWIRMASGFDKAMRTWTIIDRNGTARARVQIPARLRLLEVGPDYLLAADDSDLQLPVVKEFSLSGPADRPDAPGARRSRSRS